MEALSRPEYSALLDAVDLRAREASSNTMDLLLFSLGTSELFGINVFKVREITQTPRITRAPNLPHGVPGVVSLRGSIIPVVSLAKLFRFEDAGCRNETMMVTEFSRHVQGFLLHSVGRIARVAWERVWAPESALAGAEGYIAALTELEDGKLVSIIDVEQVLATIYGEAEIPPLEPIAQAGATVFFADDSAVARRQIVRVFDRIGVKHHHAVNGREAWERLQAIAARAETEGAPLSSRLNIILTDAEMPQMDGYVLARYVKGDPRFAGIPVVMHSSLASDANRAMGTTVGADAYVPKFDPRLLTETLRSLLMKQAAHSGSHVTE
jgi:two-component system chemotaxis response regulator CheV